MVSTADVAQSEVGTDQDNVNSGRSIGADDRDSDKADDSLKSILHLMKC